jgi:hypothetical protein
MENKYNFKHDDYVLAIGNTEGNKNEVFVGTYNDRSSSLVNPDMYNISLNNFRGFRKIQCVEQFENVIPFKCIKNHYTLSVDSYDFYKVNESIYLNMVKAVNESVKNITQIAKNLQKQFKPDVYELEIVRKGTCFATQSIQIEAYNIEEATALAEKKVNIKDFKVDCSTFNPISQTEEDVIAVTRKVLPNSVLQVNIKG